MKIKTIPATLFTLITSSIISSSAVVSVDIEEYNYTTLDLSSYYRFEVLNEAINNTTFITSPNNAIIANELDDNHFQEKVGSNVPNIRGVYVDLKEDESNDNIIDIFLRPIISSSSTHKLGITIDFELDPGQIIESITFDSGNIWLFVDPPSAADPTVYTRTNDNKSILIEYEFAASTSNPNGVQTMGALDSFEKFTITLGPEVVIPEPSSISLLSIGSLLLFRRKR